MPRKKLPSIAARALLLSGLFLAFLALGGPPAWSSAYAGSDQLQVAFTPHVTQVGWTVTPQPTIPGSLQPQIRPVPLALTPTPPSPTAPTPTPAISGGDESIGYDFIEGSDPPLWRIWYNGQELVISPNDPATAALLDEFRSAALRRAAALGDIQDAQQSATSAGAGAFWGGLAFVGGAVTAVFSCAGVPFTFWAAGGTGWACAGGIAATVGGGGAVVVSLGDLGQARGDLGEAQEELATAGSLADQAFESLSTLTSP